MLTTLLKKKGDYLIQVLRLKLSLDRTQKKILGFHLIFMGYIKYTWHN